MAQLDLHAFDQQLSAQLRKQRDAMATLWRQPELAPPRASLDSRLLSERSISLLADSDEPFAPSAHAWLVELRAQLDDLPQLRDIASRWQRRYKLDHLADEQSLRQLRDRVLSCPDGPLRAQHAQALASKSGDLALASQQQLHERWAERHERGLATPLSVHRAAATAASDCAEALLRRTADVANDQLPRDGWDTALASALGREADEGWPARLTTRWLADVVAPSGMTRGLRLSIGPLPRPLGATSFARALGQLGEALLLASRPRSLPLYAQLHPRGVRRHQRRALFAALLAEPAFAEKSLGLGAGRRERQLRGCAKALLQTLRLEALRVLLVDALMTGVAPAQERFEALTASLFGQPAPSSLLAVVPQLHHPAAGAAFLGMLLSAHDRDALVAACDEDWFRNPAATEWLRAADGLPQSEQVLSPERLAAGLERMVARLEQLLS